MESSAIYGLESQGRCLCAHTGETESIRFFVGTLSPRASGGQGHLHQIDFDEETNHISRKVWKPSGEVWQVACPPQNKKLIALTYNFITDCDSHLRAALFTLPSEEDSRGSSATSNTPGDLPVFHEFPAGDNEDTRCVDWHPSKPSKICVVYESSFSLWDLEDSSKPETVGSYKLPEEEEAKIYLGKWNPHLDGNQFSLVTGTTCRGIDTRSMSKTAWSLPPKAHKFTVRDVDFNPNKQYVLATCGDDCATRFWDIRNPSEALKEINEHSHWVWRVRFNSFHDQLVLTSSSDSRVLLHSVASISSEPSGHILFSEDDETEDKSPRRKKQPPMEEGVIARYEEHEDAVYAAEWSSYDPWIFASLSYDGRLVINRVPQSQKYKILL